MAASTDLLTGTSSTLQVELLAGARALQWLESPFGISEWGALWERSRFGTAFQAPSFTLAWYRSYSQSFQPAVLIGRESSGRLAGLWTLAYNDQSQLVHAGGHQAEYQVWLASADFESTFLRQAWKLLKETLIFDSLSFKYLPSPLALEVLQLASGLGPILRGALHRRPLLRLIASDIEASFAKKSNKSRFNRLKRIGTLEFRHLASMVELDALFDDFRSQYDLRQGGTHDSVPFRDDPCKAPFHRALFAAGYPHDCDVSVTLLNQQIVAGLWGMRTRNTLHLGMLTHSPLHAEHSPGKLHIMALSRSLLAAGVQVLDLTPGDDPWKERFANDHDLVASATMYRSAAQLHAFDLRDRCLATVKGLVGALGVRPENAKGLLNNARKLTPSRLSRRLHSWMREDREFRIYRADRALGERYGPDERVRCGDIAALTAFVPGESWQSRTAFLAAALRRLESGERSYSILIRDELAHSGWMVVNQSESRMSEVDQVLPLPPGSVTLYDFYSHPRYRGQGLYRATLGHMLHDAFAPATTRFAYISVLADNVSSRHVIESMGFEYIGSAHFHRRLGYITKWSDRSLAKLDSETDAAGRE